MNSQILSSEEHRLRCGYVRVGVRLAPAQVRLGLRDESLSKGLVLDAADRHETALHPHQPLPPPATSPPRPPRSPARKRLCVGLGDSYAYERLGGADHYETSALVAAFAAREGMSWSCVGVATGTSFPDALSASALVGTKGGVLLLTDASGASAAKELRSHSSAVSRLYVLGGTSAVSQVETDALSNALS